ncbi:MAG: membrane protein insertase YidC [Planctomycetota bacterium]|nr:MAG: membrane protein insertase YidC [Planctomycetota bacterium]
MFLRALFVSIMLAWSGLWLVCLPAAETTISPLAEPVAEHAEAVEAADAAPVAEDEEGSTADSPQPVAAPTALLSILPDYGEDVVIANEVGILELTREMGAIRRFRLREVGEIELPDHFLSEEQQGREPHPHLAVMGRHNPFGPLHNWLSGLRITPVGPHNNRGPAWEISDQQPHSVTFRHQEEESGLVYEMRYSMRPGRATADITLLVHNQGEQAQDLSPVVFPINGIHQDVGRNESWHLTVAEHRGGSGGDLVRRDSFPSVRARTPVGLVDETFDYLALKSRFFTAIWKPGHVDMGPNVTWGSQPQMIAPEAVVDGGGGPGGGGSGGGPGSPAVVETAAVGSGIPHRLQFHSEGFEQGPGGPNTKRQAFIQATYTTPENSPFRLAAGETLRITWAITIASMRGEDLARLTVEEQRLEYTDGFHRFFRVLSSILAWMLLALASIPGVGYGLGVVLLTLTIKGLLYRTTFKQQKSMMAMAKLGPELKRIQEQYKNDPQTRNAKTMELWRKHGVNPLGGCLPIFIQMPIFIALYQAFSHVAELRGESFLWIPDLTLPDQTFFFGTLLGFTVTLNVLPILYMVISLFMTFSNKPPPNTSGNDQAAQMMKIMRWLPVLFGVIFYNMPSGLVLYFTMSALISTIEIKWIRYKLGMTSPAKA